MDKLKIYLLCVLFMAGMLPAVAQIDCKESFQKAEALYNARKFDDAKKYYQHVINCGDAYLAGLGKSKLDIIETIEVKPTKNFGVSRTKVQIPYQGGDAVVTVNGSSSWNYSFNSDWCTIRKSGSHIVISSKENTGLNQRSTTIKVTSGNQYRIIEVVNEGAPEMLRSSVANVMFPSEGEINVVDIFANTDWEIKELPQWISCQKKEGQIWLTAAPNKGVTYRNSNVTIQSSQNASVVINVFQGSGKEKLSFSKNELKFGPDGGDEYIRVYTDAEDWMFGDSPHWCQLTRIGNDSIKIHCTPNAPINEIREASINVTTGLQTLGIHVSQEAKPLVIQYPELRIGGRAFSLGISAGYLLPLVSATSGGNYTGSVVNYGRGGTVEEVSYQSSGGFSIGAFADIRIYKNWYLIAGLNYTHYSYKNEYSANDMRNVMILLPDCYHRGKINDRYTEKYTMSSIEVPVLASYRFPVTPISHVQVNLGPVLSYGLSAKLNLSGYSDGEKMTAYKIVDGEFTDILDYRYPAKPHHIKSVGDFDLYEKRVNYSQIYVDQNNATVTTPQNFDASPLKRINWGIRLGLTYEYSGINVGMEYNMMITNMANKRYWDGSRWTIFDIASKELMSDYKQKNHSLLIKLGYVFRY